MTLGSWDICSIKKLCESNASEASGSRKPRPFHRVSQVQFAQFLERLFALSGQHEIDSISIITVDARCARPAKLLPVWQGRSKEKDVPIWYEQWTRAIWNWNLNAHFPRIRAQSSLKAESIWLKMMGMLRFEVGTVSPPSHEGAYNQLSNSSNAWTVSCVILNS